MNYGMFLNIGDINADCVKLLGRLGFFLSEKCFLCVGCCETEMDIVCLDVARCVETSFIII